MTQPNTTRGIKLVPKIEWPKGSGTYVTLCTGSAARGITFTNALNEIIIRDCDDADAVADISREKTSKSVSFNLAGTVHKQDLAKLEAIRQDSDSWLCKVILDDDDAANVITYSGAWHLGEFVMTGDVGQKVEGTMTFQSDGPITPAFGANVS